ncbi:mRNA 3'-end-processing protein YSH1 [Tylopilus felleus]
MADTPTLSVTLLGAGQEVGRSCCVLQYRGKTIVCDAGVHPAYSGMASLPFVDELDGSTVDATLITQYVTNFKDGKGKVYMTHPTKAVHKFMMQDFVRMSSSSSDALFPPLELSMSLSSIIPVSAYQLITPCLGVSFTPYHAGHVLKTCLRIFYTDDYSREEDRHFVKAEIPPIRPDVLIVESTFGVQSLEGRDEKELRFTSLVHSTIRRGGHVLLPAFALGRAQELLLILDEYWKKHPDLHNVPIYYASSLARKCMAVYQTYIHTMNANIRSRFAKRDNPFVFKHISNLPQPRGWERKIAEGPPCVVLASPGFLQTGPSRELLELWAPDPRNGLIITGYSIEVTLARVELHMPEETDEQENEQGEDTSRDPALIVRVDDADAHINLVSLVVISSNDALRKRVEGVLDMAVTTANDTELVDEEYTNGEDSTQRFGAKTLTETREYSKADRDDSPGQ